MISEDGLESCGFLTLTVGDADGIEFSRVYDAAEASRRIHRLARRLLPSIFERAVVVSERHQDGAIHFHLLGTLRGRPDIRSGFDFEAVKRRDYRSASDELRALWARLREELPAFGFGRSELTPVRKTGAQVASYVSKYIEKNIGARTADDKGKKLVRYIGWRKRQLKPNDFSWATPRAAAWRKSAAMLSALVDVRNRIEAAECFGPRWAFHLTRCMNATAGNAEIECGKELADYTLRAVARQFVLKAANQKWVRIRSAENARSPVQWRPNFSRRASRGQMPLLT
jgi:hypothetical protein